MARSSRMPRSWSRTLVALAGSFIPVAWAAAPSGIGETSLIVRTHRGVERFQVTQTAGDEAAAVHVAPGMADSPTVSEPGYTLYARVIVRAAEDAVAAVAAERANVSAAPLQGAPGFWLLHVASVAEAARLADQLAADSRVAEAYVDVRVPTVLRTPTDPEYPQQWHLNNTLNPIADVNVEAVWTAGYTGAGVIVGILEGGWEYTHPDLAANFNAQATQPGGSETSHGTSCAGVVAAGADNGLGGVGVAYGAQISGQIYGSSSQNAAAFGYRNDLNAIKSNSWGPSDNGRVSTMSSAERAAIETGALTGRDGKGTIFVWAAGNGGTNDRVDYDPYVSSRYTIAVGAIGDLDTRAYYNESGSSMFVVAHSSGNNRSIFTTTAGGGYTAFFGGTSSASPLAAGVIALMLEANPALTWRDVQHVLVRSARQCDPGRPSWTLNAAGRRISYDYGFGAVDALAAVQAAATWRNVRPEVRVDLPVTTVGATVPDFNSTGISRTVTMPQSLRLEAVELVMNVTTTRVGDLEITITAPTGTQSVVATQRNDTTVNYNDYLFTTVRHWDENAVGTWTVTVADRLLGTTATWNSFQLRFYGTRWPGDLNCDGLVNFDDIDAFVLALGGPAGYAAAFPDCDVTLADLNEDGAVNFDDIDPFVAALGS